MSRIAIVGAAGRMGRTLIQAVHETPGLHLTVAVERLGSSLVGSDAGELAGVGRLNVPVEDDLAAAVSRFECSRHDSKYEPDGTYTSGRATRNMDRFPVRRNGDTIVVNVATLIQSDTNKAQWDAAAVTL